MEIKDKIIIVSSKLNWEFVCDYEKQTIERLSKNNKVIVFESPSQATSIWKKLLTGSLKDELVYSKNGALFISELNLIPFIRIDIVRYLNSVINKVFFRAIVSLHKLSSREKTLLWIFFPQDHDLVEKFGEDLSIYDCVDHHSSSEEVLRKKRKGNEEKLLNKVDLVFANSTVLYKSLRKRHKKVHLVPQGFDLDMFETKGRKSKISKDLGSMKKPIIGYVGNIDYRMDFDLIESVALDNQDAQFVFVGPVLRDVVEEGKVDVVEKLNSLKSLNNVSFFGRRPKSEMYSIIESFNVCWIPFNMEIESVKYSYPMKVFEYFYVGKPVVSTKIVELENLKPFVYIASGKNGFNKVVNKLIKNGWGKESINKQRRISKENSWQNKLAKMGDVIENHPF